MTPDMIAYGILTVILGGYGWMIKRALDSVSNNTKKMAEEISAIAKSNAVLEERLLHHAEYHNQTFSKLNKVEERMRELEVISPTTCPAVANAARS